MPTVRFELTWGFRPVDLESTPIDQATGSRHLFNFIVLVSGEWDRTTDLLVMSQTR